MFYFQVPFTPLRYSQSLNSYWEHSKQVHRSFQWWSSGDFLRYSDSAWNIRRCDWKYVLFLRENPSCMYGYYRVDACPQQPILIRYESINLLRSTANGYFVSDNRLYTPSLGTGPSSGLNQITMEILS